MSGLRWFFTRHSWNVVRILYRKNKLLEFPKFTFVSNSKQYSSCPVDLLTEDEQILKETVSRVASEKISPLVSKMDFESHMEPSVIQALFDNGLMGIEIPSEFGGTNANFLSTILCIEELSKVDSSVGALCDIHNTVGVNTFLLFASKEHKNDYLPRFAKDTVCSFCLSEDGSGSDAFALKASAKREGDEFVINGTKMWISNSEQAGVFIVFANANPELGYRGISAFIVERGVDGLSLGKKENKLGIRASSTCPVHLDNVRVPMNKVIGELGQGYKYCIEVLNEGRVGIAAQMLGLSEGCFNKTLSYVMETRQFGESIFEYQATQHQIAHVATQIEALRMLVYNTARKRDMGHDIVLEGAMAKYFAAEVATLTTSRCMEWMGRVGFTTDYPIEKFYRDVKIGSIYEGTSNIQLNTIAKYLARKYTER